MDAIAINILLLEPDEKSRNNITGIISEKGWKIHNIDNSYKAIQELKNNGKDIDLLIINKNCSPLNANQTINYIENELKLKLPVLIILDAKDKSINPESGLYFIKKPFKKSDITIIEQLLNVHENVDFLNKQQPYSLNYLKNLSDGDESFILDCLKVFKISVTAKLQQLDEAFQKNDQRSVGEIAHNIKPSFEMLENDIAAKICNQLTYNYVETEIPVLIAQLIVEFNRIMSELEKEFVELKQI